MRCLVLSLVLCVAAASAAQAQQKSARSLPLTLGSPDSAPGGLRGVYGPPESGVGQLRGVYAPVQSAPPTTALPSTIAGSGGTTSDTIPNVTVPTGEAHTGDELPQGVKPSPMADRPGYGRAIVNGRNAIVDTNSHQIVQFSD